MKTRLALLISIVLLGSCAKPELNDRFIDPLTYEYNADQPTILDIIVIPTENIDLKFKELESEVNADYFHRYGIHVNVILGERENLPDAVVNGNQYFLPQPKTKEEREILKVYIVPQHLIKFEFNGNMALAYALPHQNAIILGENVQDNRTLAHEIGHIFGLDHTDKDEYFNNVMTPFNRASRHAVPNDFENWQIDMITNGILSDENLTAKNNEIHFN